MGVHPQQLLCLTFTNRAAQQMQDGLKACDQLNQLTVKTFHGLCAHILRQEASKIGLSQEFVIYDEQDSLDLLKELSGISDSKRLSPLTQKIQACKLSLPLENMERSLERPQGLRVLFDERMTEKGFKIACQYQYELQQRQAIDFDDLVYYVRALLVCEPEARERWCKCFEFIQVDEVQDTHWSEYEVIWMLAKHSRNLAMIGDLDQTIYEWRGSEPIKLKESFESCFSPQTYHLTKNYRATQILVNAASAFADCFLQRYTHSQPAQDRPLGTQIQVYEGYTERDEGQWIAQRIQDLAAVDPDFAYYRVAVLARTHRRASAVFRCLSQAQVPCVTVEEFAFFRRQEVKDAISYLKLLSNPFDTGSLRRILLRFVEKVGSATVGKIIASGSSCGLRLTDFIQCHTLQDGDPFAPLLKAWSSGTVIVFDVETTGLLASSDEVIELAAIKLENGQSSPQCFHAYLKNTVPIGESERIHGISEQDLALKGRSAVVVFEEFIDFAQDAVWVGHNVGFDIKMLRSHARRLDIDIPIPPYADTCEIARRFVKGTRNFKLETLAKVFELQKRRAHSALEDTKTTTDLLVRLIPLVQHDIAERCQVVQAYAPLFDDLALDMNRWKSALSVTRPPEFLRQIIREAGIDAYYQREPHRIVNLWKLVKFFRDHDPITLDSETALRELLVLSACSTNVDMMSEEDNLVPIITVHQSKGLEFDTVFIAGAVEGEFPDFRNLKGPKLEEEKRAFYVAMTRAKKALYLSGYQVCDRGYPKSPSRFLDCIPQSYKTSEPSEAEALYEYF